MGINLLFAKYLFKKQEQFNYKGKLLTLGRQDIGFTLSDLKSIGLKVKKDYPEKINPEQFFEILGFETVNSLDYSSHDNPTIINDLNLPITKDL